MKTEYGYGCANCGREVILSVQGAGERTVVEACGCTREATKVVPTTEVHVGDKITELDTPEGPFYTVTRETAKSFWVDASGPMRYSQPCEVRFAKSPRMGVRLVV